MNLSVSTWNYLCEKRKETNHEQSIRAIIEDGFGVELWTWNLEWLPDPEIVEPSKWDHWRELLSGAPAISIHTSAAGGFSKYNENGLKKEVDMCAHLAGLIVVVHALSTDEKIKDFSHIRELARYAQGKGVFLALENGRLEYLKQIIEKVDILSGDGGLGICIDVGHANLLQYGYSVERYLDEFREKLIHLHLADNFKEKDDHLPPGEGNIDWKMVLSKLRDFDFRGMGVLEINSKQARKNAQKTRKLLNGLAGEIGWE